MNNPYLSTLDQLWAQSYIQQSLVILIIAILVHLVGNIKRADLERFRPVLAMVLGLFGWTYRAPAEIPFVDEEEHSMDSIRTRAQQLKKMGFEEPQPTVAKSNLLYPGLVNISGTYCFMNATIQALASCVYLQPFLERLHARAEELDVPTPVTDALRDILIDLNQPSSRFRALRPIALIEALANSSIQNHNTLFLSREHQDAQELFQLLSSVLSDETVTVQQEALKDFGLSGLKETRDGSPKLELYTPFEGLSANRRTCCDCGYTEAVMHFPFDNVTLALPPMTSCGLEDCLAEYTRLEQLNDCICRKCSLLATLRKFSSDSERSPLKEDVTKSPSRKKRERETRRLEGRVKAAIDDGRIEEDIKGVKVEKVYSSVSVKQTMIARPPPIFVIHMNRSTYFGGGYARRNPCRVHFPELLDLTDYTTSGQLNLSPNASLSSPISFRASPMELGDRVPVLYRLSSVVCHYGTHSRGHYVAFRRKPRPPSYGSKRYVPPSLVCPLDCICEDCRIYGPVRDESTGEYGGWLRTNDDAVEEVSLSSVLRESSGTFMLYYERVLTTLDGSASSVVPAAPTHGTGLATVCPRGRILQRVQVGSRRRASPSLKDFPPHLPLGKSSDLSDDELATPRASVVLDSIADGELSSTTPSLSPSTTPESLSPEPEPLDTDTPSRS